MVVKAPREILDMNRSYLDNLETSSYEDEEDGVDGPVKHMSEEQAIDYVIRVGGNNSNNKNKTKSFDKDLEEDESEDGQVWALNDMEFFVVVDFKIVVFWIFIDEIKRQVND